MKPKLIVISPRKSGGTEKLQSFFAAVGVPANSKYRSEIPGEIAQSMGFCCT